MTTAFILAALSSVFVIGFLLGDRRGVKQARDILDEHCRELLKAVGEEPSRQLGETDSEDRPATPTVH